MPHGCVERSNWQLTGWMSLPAGRRSRQNGSQGTQSPVCLRCHRSALKRRLAVVVLLVVALATVAGVASAEHGPQEPDLTMRTMRFSFR